MSSEDQKRVFLWAVPRSLSTALSMCMSSVAGIQVWHEPYQYTHHKERFLEIATSSDPIYQHTRKLIKAMPKAFPQKATETPKGNHIDDKFFEYPWVKKQLETDDEDKDLIFVKDMAYLLHGKYDYLPTGRKYRHTFLIRNPHYVYQSLWKLIYYNTPAEHRSFLDMRRLPTYDAHRIFHYTHYLWKYVKDNLDSDPVIIDAADLTANPDKILPKYFDAIGVPWKDDYLTWDASPEVTLQWKASHQAFDIAKKSTHKTAIESTRFVPCSTELPSRGDMTEDVIECIEEAMPFYNEMYERRLKP